MSRSVLESLVGLAVLLVALVSVYLAFQSSSDVQQVSGYQVSASFDNAGGLAPGTDVRLAGVKIGTVAEHRIDPETFLASVTLNIDSAVSLPVDSAVRIVPDGLLGANFVEISPGGAEEMIPPGGRIEDSRGAINVVELVSRIVTLAVQATAEQDEKEAGP